MADDPFMKELGYPGGGSGGGGAAPSSPAPSGDDSPNAADVGRGIAKSGAGTLVAIPRLANAAVGLIPRVGTSWRKTLGDLAEQVPGVQRLEEFADSPNKNWAESAGYWGGEGLQLFGGGLLGEAAKGAEAASAATKGGRAAEDVEGVIDWSKMRTERPLKALPPPREVPFSATADTGQSLAQLPRRVHAAEGAAYAEDLQAGRAQRALGRAQEPMRKSPLLGLEEITPSARTASPRWPYSRSTLAGLAQRSGRAAAGGGIAGAVTDPQDPGTGFVSGATLGGATPLGGLALRSGVGKFMASHGARSAAAGGAMALGKAMGIPTEWLWFVGIPQLLRFWHSGVGRSIGESAAGAASSAGSAMARSSGRVPGAAAGAVANQFAPAGGLHYEPVPEEQQP